MMSSAKARAAALVAAGVVGGGVLAGTLSATAATGTTTTTPSASSGTAAPPGTPAAGGPTGAGQRPGPGGAQPVRSDEKLVTGADATTLKVAALKAVPGGTVIRVETDSGDATYEAHMTRSDGSVVTVKFDKSLNVTSVEDGMGK
jgi:hypothetical protein